VPVRDLPGDPSLEHLRNQARSLQQRVRAIAPEAVAAVRDFHPRLAGDGGLMTKTGAPAARARPQPSRARPLP
jgi:hypothetical protein